MIKRFDVIIVGGGPTGIALGIELGLNNVKTLILEKYAVPLLSPRAQLINARSMEFFMRWNLDSEIISKQISSTQFPNVGIWCSKLNGKTYAISNSNEFLSSDLSPQKNIRIPLWITEDILRNKLKEFPSVTFLKEQEAIDIEFSENEIRVRTLNNEIFKSSFLIGCDGVNSLVRRKSGIPFKSLSDTKRVISVVFEAPTMEHFITVEKGCLFFLMDNPSPTAIGSIDPIKGLWYAQILYKGEAKTIEEINLDHLLNEISGIQFPKKIRQAHFWEMKTQIAERFSHANRIFLVGDSAHGFVPTGALGLNTGFGDVVNLGWKLSSVIHKKMSSKILESYELERRPICLRNLEISQQNADDLALLKKKYHSKENITEFAKANAKLAQQFSQSLGVILGYAYFNSPLTLLKENQDPHPAPKEKYIKKAGPGYFLPHQWINQKSIYSFLSPVHWTLIISGSYDELILQDFKACFGDNIEVLNFPENTYNSKYILIRPDWHIVLSEDRMTDKIYAFLENIFTQ